MKYEVTTQLELDDAIKRAGAVDVIVCLGGTRTAPLKVKEAVKATIWADGFSKVWAYGSSTVWAHGFSKVWADGSSTIWADGFSTIWAGEYVTVQNAYGSHATITGGVLIQLHGDGEWTADEWIAAAGLEPDAGGNVVAFKAVDDDWSTSQARAAGIFYTPGTVPACTDWNDRAECGGGLHVSPAPIVARAYNVAATRYVGVPVAAGALVVIDGMKAKVERAAGPVFEVDVHGERMSS